MTYGDFKDLTKRTVADKVLRDKAFKIASDIWRISKRISFNGIEIF